MRPRVGFVVLLCAFGSTAWGERPTARLSVRRSDAARACPNEARIARNVVAILGYDPFHDLSSLEIACAIERTNRTYRATIVVQDGVTGARGERVISSGLGDCDELARSAALAIALVIDPWFDPDLDAAIDPMIDPVIDPAIDPVIDPMIDRAIDPAIEAADSSIGSPVAREAVASAPSPAIRDPDASARERASVSPRGVYFQAGARMGGGVQPGPTMAGAWGFGVRWTWLSVDAEAGLSARTTRSLPEGNVSSMRLWGAVVPCAHLGRVAGCAVLSGGVIQATGDFEVDGQADTPWIAAGARAVAELPLGSSLRLRASIDLLTPLFRTTLTVSGDPVWRAPLVGTELGLAAVVHFR